MAARTQRSRARRLARVGLTTLLLCGGCVHRTRMASALAESSPPSSAAEPAPRSRATRYEFKVSPGLDALQARVCFDGPPPDSLTAALRSDDVNLREAWFETPGGRRPLPVDLQAGRMDLRAVPVDGCVGYAVELRGGRSLYGGPRVERHGDALVTNTACWLWREPDYRQSGPMTARFTLPDGMAVSVPWKPEADGYRLEPSALAFYAFAVFGRFETEHIAAPGADISVAVLPGLPPATRAEVVPWLRTAASAASLAFGHFPRARAQVVVIPSPPADEPVRFGTTNRGGGASAAMRLPVNADLNGLLHDWVAVHEFSHLLHPFIVHQDAWLPEGLATYFQEVLRVRAGMESEGDAWRRLYEGARRAQDSADRSLAEESADMFASASFKTVYWGGASFALRADVELLRRSAGRLSLEGALKQLAPVWARDPRPRSADEVIADIDAVAGAPMLAPLMRRWVDGPKLPDLDELYARVGVSVDGADVRFEPDAVDAWIRHRIMRPDAGAARGAEPASP